MNILLLSTIFLFSTLAHAHIYVNHGPFFRVANAGKTITQQRLVADYVLFAGQTASQNRARFTELSRVAKVLQANPRAVLPYMPKRTDAFDFTYKDDNGYLEWPFLRIEYGLCQGFTSGLRNFHYFGVFRPSLRAPFGPHQPKERMAYYKHLVDEVFLGRVAVIPEFKNLDEFSRSSRELEHYIQVHVANSWAIYNVVEGGKDYLNITPIKDLQGLATLQQNLAALLARNFQPRILWKWGEWKEVHVLRVASVAPVVNGCFKTLLIDTDASVEEHEICTGASYMMAKHEWEHFADYYVSFRNFCLKNPQWCR